MDLIIIRHFSSGAPYFLAKNTYSSVINAGDGSHAHPTQTLSDLFTIFELDKKIDKDQKEETLEKASKISIAEEIVKREVNKS